jgi:hypothetical protein
MSMHVKFLKGLVAASLATLVSAGVAGCGDRPAVWDAPVGDATPLVGLTWSVALIDDATHRAVLLRASADQQLSRHEVKVGRGVMRAVASPDRKRLFVLSSGDVPRRSENDELPSLTVIDQDGAGPPRVERYELTSPHSDVAIDPEGEWAAIYAGSGGPRRVFVENPNEILFVDLRQKPSAENPVARTLRSFGGKPERLTFTPRLSLPGRMGRLLVVETARDLALLDLDHVAEKEAYPEVTVGLTGGANARVLKPAGIAIDEGEPSRDDDTRIGVRIQGEPNVYILQLGPRPPESRDRTANVFDVTLNIADVGGPPTDIAFVRTDQGVRLAALVPQRSAAVLVEPETAVTSEPINVARGFQRISLVSSAFSDGPPGGEGTSASVALLWNGAGSASGVAFWALGKASGQPYRSVDVLPIDGNVVDVLDVRGAHPELKVLKTGGANQFFVLDLKSRTVAPLVTDRVPELYVSPGGERAWAYAPQSAVLAAVRLSDLHPVPLLADRPVRQVFEIARDDGGQALVAIHSDRSGSLGATVFDALKPDTATSRQHSALLLEGLQ